jgi:c(7)-type cytochrome triheme protein
MDDLAATTAGRPGEGPGGRPRDARPPARRPRRAAVLLLAAALAAGGGAALAGRAAALEGVIQFKRAPGGPMDTPPAAFPHWVHRIRYRCYVCHPAEIKPSPAPITHDAMATGQACGACHDGRTAWGITFETCARCHVAR